MLETYNTTLLSMIAENWDVPMPPGSQKQQIEALAALLQPPQVIREFLEIQPPEVNEALQNIAAKGGLILWTDFSRTYGEIEIIGPAQLKRLRPDRNPRNLAERMYYAGLIGKGFLKNQSQPQEFAFLPQEVLAHFSEPQENRETVPGRPALETETSHIILANTAIVDDSCTLLAARRMALDDNLLSRHMLRCDPGILSRLLQALGLLDDNLQTIPDSARTFLELPRAQALQWLVQGWQASTNFNELLLLPGLIFEGVWKNDPFAARSKIVEILADIPAKQWWSLRAFIQYMRDEVPDFQRSGGEYETWMIRPESQQQYLHGLASWDAVEGQWLFHLIVRFLFWLGLVDLAAPAEDAPIAAFRWSAWAEELLAGNAPSVPEPAADPIHINSNGTLAIPRSASLPVRYQLARFLEWREIKSEVYLYRLTAASLQNAESQGLQAQQFLSLLKGQVELVPPTLITAIQRWQKHHITSTISSAILLRCETPEILQALQKTRAARFILETINPSLCLIKPGGVEAIQNALAGLGYFVTIQDDFLTGTSGRQPHKEGS